MHWWYKGSAVKSGPPSQDISYQVNGWHGPFSSKAAALAAMNSGGGSGGGGTSRALTNLESAEVSVLNTERGGLGDQWQRTIERLPGSNKALFISFCGRHGINPGAADLLYGFAQEKVDGSNNPIPPPFQNLPNPVSGLASVGDLASRLTDPNTWARAGEVVIGSLILIVGIYVLVKDTKTGKAVTSKAKSAAKTAAKAAVIA
jgi:hypothetical protein